jgi:hypothetical protein
MDDETEIGPNDAMPRVLNIGLVCWDVAHQSYHYYLMIWHGMRLSTIIINGSSSKVRCLNSIYMVRQKYDDTLDALDALASILMGGDSVMYHLR